MRLERAQRETGLVAYVPRREEDLTSPILKEALAVWKGQCPQPDGLPPAASFDVLDYRPVMGRINFMEVREEPLDFVFRVHAVVGTNFAGLDMTGRSVTEYPDPQYRAFVWDVSKRAKEERKAQIVVEDVLVKVPSLSNDGQFRWEGLVMPLQDREGRVTRLVVVFDLLG